MNFPKVLLLFTLFILSLQQYIVTEKREFRNCTGSIKVGTVIKNDVCFQLTGGIFMQNTHKGNTYIHKNLCDETCSTCRMSSEYRYGCLPAIGNVFHTNKPEVTETGFYYNTYTERERVLCDGSGKIGIQSFYHQTTCISGNILLGDKVVSARVGYLPSRNGVGIEVFNQRECQGPVANSYFINEGKCTRIPERRDVVYIKISKNIQ